MYKTIMENISNVGVFPVISLLIFFAVFMGMLWWVAKMDKRHTDHMGQLPLETGAHVNIEGEGNHGN